MLDINKIRDNKKTIEQNLRKRLDHVDLDSILKLDDQRRALLQETEGLKNQRNQSSQQKPKPEEIAALKKASEHIKKLDAKLAEIEAKLQEKLAALPNITADDVIAGNKENNQVIKTFGKKPEFKFTPKDHVELATALELIDYKRGAKMSGNGFWIYTGQGALLEWALLNYFVDFHKKNKYTFILPPYLLSEKSAYISGHLPKFRDDLYWNQDNLCLNATSEMMLGNLHADEIMDEADLPKKYFAYSTCFRREAGAYRHEERGMIRGHQFNKIEMFQVVKPEDSWSAFEELKNYAEKLVEGLGLHYQTVQLAAQDTSSAMAKTVDLEVWIPSMNTYKEVSSISNALDYQARRGNIRFKNPKINKNEFVHTLNASGLATSRLLPAILEQFQDKDGRVKIPKALTKYLNAKYLDRIK